MNNINDFMIKDGVLLNYIGKDTEIIIPDSVERIESGAFEYDCETKKIVIPASVKFIENGAFSFFGMTGIECFIVDKNNLNYSSIDGNLYNKEGTILIKYADGKEAEELVIPEGVLKIANNAIEENEYLEDITIPKSLIIEESDIPNRYNLHFVNRNMKEIPGEYKKEALFEYCNDMNSKVYDNGVIKSYVNYAVRQRKKLYDDILDCNSLLDFMIENKIIPVEDCANVIRAVRGNNDLVTKIYNYKAKNFSAEDEQKTVEKIIKKAENINPLSVSELKKIWKYEKLPTGGLAISGYKGSDLEIVVPSKIGKDDVVQIDSYAFSPKGYNVRSTYKEVRKKITSVVIPDSVSVIKDHAFYECKALKSVDFSSNVTEVGELAFFSTKFFDNEKNWRNNELSINGVTVAKKDSPIFGMSFAVTGNLEYYHEDYDYYNIDEYNYPMPDRTKFQHLLETHGAKLTNSVLGKTNYLICNDTGIGTSKIDTARSKNVPIISEEEFFELMGEKMHQDYLEVLAFDEEKRLNRIQRIKERRSNSDCDVMTNNAN